ncbi:MAG: glycosyltransferase family 4 protein [Candidatus Hydrogenedentes bacterium]|nr:glycosyltransferase family 4 protein [Candidatus Hydrogenedentota bacterium]
MRILHVTPYHQPKMGYQENYLPAAQKRLGHEVMLLTSDRYPPHPNYKETMKWTENKRIVGAGRYQEDGIDVLRLPVSWEWPAHWWVYLPKLWKEIGRFNPDVIHAHCINGMLTYQVLWGNLFRGRNVIVDDHNNYFNKVPYTWKKWVFYRLQKYLLLPILLRRVKRVLPMSHEVREYLWTELGVPRACTTLNHLGADPEEFKRDEGLGRATRKKYGIAEDAVVFVNSGKITEVKDTHILLEAMGDVVAQEERAHLIMIGNAPAEYRARLQAIIARRGIQDHVNWIDFLPHDELTAHYSAADVGIWPGDWSCTVIEAAACGVALIQPDLLYTKYSSANKNSLNFERGNSHDLAEKMLTLVRDDALRRDMGRRSRELIETELNWDNLARQTIEIYQKCLNNERFE